MKTPRDILSTRTLSRREMLRELMLAGLSASAATAVLSGCGKSTPAETASTSVSTALASTETASGETSGPIKIGFIPLTDCASVVVAQEKGFFKKYGVEVEVKKMANWLAVRDQISSGELDGAHCLFGMPFSVASGVSKAQGAPMKIAMILNNNGQATTLADKYFAGVKYADFAGFKTKVDAIRASGKQPTFAMTFPGGTHDMWIHLTLAAAGIDPKSVQVKVIPPPQMVANMTAGNMMGYNVGEPWGGKAVAEKIGFTFINTQDLWKDHPEKALVVNGDFAEKRKSDLKKVMMAIIDASKYIDEMKNRGEVAEIIGTKAYTGAEPKVIADRLAGKYNLGGVNGTRDYAATKTYMKFFDGGKTNAPRASYGLWFLTQYVRFGKLPVMPEGAQKMVDDILLTDLYNEVATEMKVALPSDDMKPISIAADKGVVFDPTKPADSLKTYTALLNERQSRLA